jgi:hypothetical protein
MKRHFYYIFIAALAAAVSCTNTDYLDVDDVDPILVLNGQMKTGETTHGLFLSSSSLSALKGVDNANVSVSVNGGAPIKATLYVAPEDDYSQQYYSETRSRYDFDYTFSPGDVITVTASDGKHPTAQATASVPLTPVLKNVEIVHNVPHSSSNSFLDIDFGGYTEPTPYYPYEDSPYPIDSWHQLKITLQDLPGDTYYRLEVFVEYEIDDGETKQNGQNGISPDVSSEPVLSPATNSEGGLLEAILEESNRYNIFSDDLFKDKEYTLNLFFSENYVFYLRQYYTDYYYNEETGEWEPQPVPENLTYKTKMVVRLYAISHEQYIYLKALDLGDLAMFFSEPVSIPSNVEGGMGFVTIDNNVETRLDY